MKRIALFTALTLTAATTAQADMQLSFKGWGNIPSCTTGRPNTVGNPAFTLKGIPTGTTQVQIRLKDLNVPGYNHGGSKVKMTADGTIPEGTFKYKSPCPPSGSHTYEWTATAKKGSKTLAKAKASKKYP